MFDARFHLIFFFDKPAVRWMFILLKAPCFKHQSQSFRTSADDVVVDREVSVAWKPVPRIVSDRFLVTRIVVMWRNQGYDVAASHRVGERDAPEKQMCLLVVAGTFVS